MKTGIRIVACGSLAAIALTLAVFTLAGFSPSEPKPEYASEQIFTLGESGGNIAVFTSGDMSSPVLVTNIELSQLRETDRDMISHGLIAGSEDELVRLLEDLGS